MPTRHILADVMARFYRLLGNDTFFLTVRTNTGQDRRAAARRTKPEAYADRYSNQSGPCGRNFR
jgi:methionyl-tRNA synthetase